MESQIKPDLHKNTTPLPYCSDPNCVSCKEIKEMHDRVRTGKGAPASSR
jgi:hypothetical protein